MLINFCPNCGHKADQGFNFCPQCGVKLPKEETVVTAETTAAWDTSPIAQGPETELTGRKGGRKTQSPVTSPQKCSASTPIKNVIPSPATPPIYKTIVEGPKIECMGRIGPRNKQSTPSSPKKMVATPVKEIIPSPAVPPINKTYVKDAQPEVCQTEQRGRSKRKASSSSPQKQTSPIKQEPLVTFTSPADISGVKDAEQEVCQTVGRGRGKRKAPASSPQKQTALIEQVPLESATSLVNISMVKGIRSPQKKRNKSISLEPLAVNQILTDNSSNNWKLVTLLSRDSCGLLYAADSACKSFSGTQRYSVKLDTKNGRLYNEHNFLQRAAKKVTVDKWKKSHEMSFLGIPNCIGFGLHADTYRFLVFPDLGKSLQSVLDASADTLSERAIFQIAYRMLDVFEYIHENEYVHGDVKAEDIFVNPADLTVVYLANYPSVYRYCPGGKHVAYLEGSRNSHEGVVEFISLDIHKGAGPSRRSDLEMLGYCVLKWFCGSLPWSKEAAALQMIHKERYKADVAALLKQSFGKKKYPDVLKTYLDYVMCLKYEDKPDYDGLRRMFAAPLDKMKASAYGPVDLKVLP